MHNTNPSNLGYKPTLRINPDPLFQNTYKHGKIEKNLMDITSAFYVLVVPQVVQVIDEIVTNT